jgi:hypothetical protein
MIQLVQSLDLNAVSLRMQALFFAGCLTRTGKGSRKGWPKVKKKNAKLFTNFAFFHLFSNIAS